MIMEFSNICAINEDRIQRVVLYTPGNGRIMGSSWQSVENNDVDYVISDSNLQGTYNRPHILFGSAGQFSATIDFGDGTVETYTAVRAKERTFRFDEGIDNRDNLTGGSYYLFLVPTQVYPYLVGSYNAFEYQYNGERKTCYRGYWDTEKQEWYNGIYHEYNDSEEHSVVITLTGGNITTFGYYSGCNARFLRELQLPYLRSLNFYLSKFKGTMNYSLFTFLDTINSIRLDNSMMSSDKVSYIPDGLFTLPNLAYLNIGAFIDYSSNTNWWNDMNMDRVTNLVNLSGSHLIIASTRFYDKLPNSLFNIPIKGEYYTVQFGSNYSVDYTGVIFNTKPVRIFDHYVLYEAPAGGYNPSKWRTELTDVAVRDNVDLTNVRFYCTTASNAPSNMTEETTKNFPESYNKLWGITTFVDSDQVTNGHNNDWWDWFTEGMYNMTTSHPMSGEEDGHRNHWYYDIVYVANSFNIKYGPTGTYQAPEGFEQGVSNGTPASALEMIYVLTHNYAQTWYLVEGTYTPANAISTFALDTSTNKYTLFQNKEGNWLLGTPNTFVAGMNEDTTLFFDNPIQVQEYVKANNLSFICDDALDSEILEYNKKLEELC